MPGAANRRPARAPGQVAAASRPLLLLLLAGCAGTCLGAPVLFQGLQPEEELQLWNEIDDACSTLLSLDSQPQETDEKIIPKVLISLFEDTEIGQFKCCGRIPRSYPNSKTVFVQATQWKKFRRLHLKWITNYFPQKRHQGMQNVNIFFSSQKQSLLNLSCLRIPVL
uniref:neuromedin-U isoform X5 n=1 Tax=Halichoerus grypus TaxID=9711 RepID=UPI0016591063|nr:neuromedin-U isoform X5 [Halichoerus grypus]